MANKKTKSKKKSKASGNKSKAGSATSPENSRAESITVFWTTSILATVIGEVGGLATRSILVFMEEPYPPLELLSGLLLMISCVTGLVSMALLPLVYRWRREPPPWPIVRFAIVAAVLPFVILIAMTFFGG